MLSKSNRLPRAASKKLRFTQRWFGKTISFFTTNRQDSFSTRFAISVPKRLDKRSTVRNRIKRVVSEELRLLIPRVVSGFDILILLKEPFTSNQRERVKIELTSFMENAGLLKKIPQTKIQVNDQG